MTSKQTGSFTEKAILALYQIIKGDTIDMNRIGEQVKTKMENFDSDLLKIIY